MGNPKDIQVPGCEAGGRGKAAVPEKDTGKHCFHRREAARTKAWLMEPVQKARSQPGMKAGMGLSSRAAWLLSCRPGI